MGKVEKFQRVDIGKLRPYENNSKLHSSEQVEQIAKSIDEFGFISPVLIDKDFNIIAGHGRIMASEMLGLKKVPCLMVEGLTDEQRRAYILADNKLTELGEWDAEMVAAELGFLDASGFDIDLTGFSLDDLEVDELEAPDLPYGAERKRTDDAYNLGIAHNTEMTADFWQMPKIKPIDYTPSDLIGFNYAKTSKNKQTGIHFFVDDYQFERVWNYPEKYIEVLKDYECILTPDFSLYMDMPMPMKIWNIYRSRQIGAYYQGCGLKVIPTISWAETATFEFCFEGLEKGGTVAVSTVGVKRDEKALEIWTVGMEEMMSRLDPDTVIVYGGEIDFDYGNANVVYYENHVTEEWKDD